MIKLKRGRIALARVEETHTQKVTGRFDLRGDKLYLELYDGDFNSPVFHKETIKGTEEAILNRLEDLDIEVEITS